MPIEVRIEDGELAGFSEPAKTGLQKAGADFLKSVIEEANRLESAHNTGGGPTEITQVMVSDAVVIQRRALGTRKKPISVLIMRIAASVLSLVVGFMYDDTKLQNAAYMAVFVILVSAAVILTTVSTLKE